MSGFDIRKYIDHSKALDVSDLDWEHVREHPLSATERCVLAYFGAIEAYTVAYARDLLNTRLIEDAEAATFIPLWAYEETYHGRALFRFVNAHAGDNVPPIGPPAVQRAGLLELITRVGSQLLGVTTRHFVAVHMTWGALNELTANAAYNLMGARTKHPTLRTMLARIAKDERRHFAFYYDQAARRLESRIARKLVRFVLNLLWTPVGTGIAEQAEVDATASLLFSGPDGMEQARAIDERMATLPGLEGTTYLQDAARRAVARAQKRLARESGEVEGSGAAVAAPTLPEQALDTASRN